MSAFNDEVKDGWMPKALKVCGDFQCIYCDYKAHCIKGLGLELGYTHAEYCDRLEALLDIRSKKK